MKFKIISAILPTLKEDNTGISILLDTGSKISVYTSTLESFMKRFPNSVNSDLYRPIGGFGKGFEICPVYIIPKLSICGIDIINLPVAICENDDIISDLVLAAHVFTNNVFTLHYKTKEIEFLNLNSIICKYTVIVDTNYVDSFIVFEGTINNMIDTSQCTEDEYKNLCERADYYGVDSLTEEEQYILMNYKNYNV